jgi:mediator of RNA polymerase II transcription subunit 10
MVCSAVLLRLVLTCAIAAIIDVEGQLKDIVQNLYNLIVQAYDHHGSKTQEAIRREMYAIATPCV